MSWKTRLLLMATVCALMVAFAPAARADVITHGSTSVTMDFVTVGDAGNVADAEVMSTDGTTGYGSVPYAYRIGKYEVSEAQWDAVVAANAGDLLNDPGYWGGNQPVAAISWNEAAMFCNWLTSGNVTQGAYAINGSGVVTGIDRAAAASTYGTVYFIPTEDEWYKAAYYKGGGTSAGYWDYPTQDDVSNPPDGIDFSGDPDFDAVFSDGGYHLSQPNNADNAGVLSAYGTMGQGGNVFEWNETLITGSSRGLRGGPFEYGLDGLPASLRFWHDPSSIEHDDLGFRVASNEVVPEPGSLALTISGATLALIWRWRRK